jgi:general L-amino acid transport system substrate-binding protein
MKKMVRMFMSAFLAICGCHTANAQTLKAVKERGELVCGVGQGLTGFSYPDEKGNWAGFDVDSTAR